MKKNYAKTLILATMTTLAALPAAAQQGWTVQTTLAVTADNFVRTPLIEEFTSMPCPNCPYMAYYLEKGLELWRGQGKGPIVYLSRRSGYRYDPFTSEADKAMEYLFNGDMYNPAVTFNRTQFEGETGIMFGSYFDSGEQFMAMFDYAAAQYAKAELAARPRRTDDGRVELTVEGRVARDFASPGGHLRPAGTARQESRQGALHRGWQEARLQVAPRGR